MNKLDVKQGEWIDYLQITYNPLMSAIDDLQQVLSNTSLEQLVSEAGGYDITETVGDLVDTVLEEWGLDPDDFIDPIDSDFCQLVWDHYGLLDTTDVETDVKKLLGE